MQARFFPWRDRDNPLEWPHHEPEDTTRSDRRAPAHAMPLLRKAGLFLPLPLLFVAAAFLFAQAAGPFYLAYRYDPEYAYLLNGLNLVLGWRPEHIDHPGTPLQLCWALILRFSQPTASGPALEMHVLMGAEGYLQGVSTVFLLSYGLALVWLGVTVARLTGSRAAAWLAQATPFLLEDNFLLFLRVNPEPFLLLLGLALIPWLLRSALADPPTGPLPLALPSLLVATGLCLKITYVPIWLAVVFLLRGWRARAWFAGLTAAGCLLWTLPIMTQYPRFAAWVWGLAAHRGQYGLGAAGWVHPMTYLAGLGSLLEQNRVFTVMLLVSLLTWGLSRRRAPDSEGGPVGRWRRLLAGLVLAQVAQLLIGAKNPQSRYLAPAAALVALNGVVILQILRASGRDGSPRLRRLGPLAASLIAVVLLGELGLRYSDVRGRARQHLALSELTAPPTAGARIYYYGASSPVYARVFGSAFAGLHYSSAIEAALGPTPGRTLFLDNWRGILYSLRGRIDPHELNSIPGPILLQGDYLSEPERRRLPMTGTLTVLRRFEDETVYELRPNPRE